jgi:hypothetical protein
MPGDVDANAESSFTAMTVTTGVPGGVAML